MPKINVYLPAEVADAVKALDLPVSAICQRALEQSLRRVTAIRATVLGDVSADDLTAQLSQFTLRARTVIGMAIMRARDVGAAAVGTDHLLAGMLEEGGNLAMHVLRVMEVEPKTVEVALGAATGAEDALDGDELRFSVPAANALELTVTGALALGHNYVGCEHMLLGLVAEPDGVAGQVLRDLGVEQRSARRTVVAALAGYTHLRAQSASAAAPAAATMIADAVRQELAPIVERIERLEQATAP